MKTEKELKEKIECLKKEYDEAYAEDRINTAKIVNMEIKILEWVLE